jgi:hypothetical protein
MAKIIFPILGMALRASWSGMTGDAPAGRAVLLAP